MLVTVTFTPVELEIRDVSSAAVVAIDCFRASASIVRALGAGAEAVYPFLSVEEAFEEREKRPGAVLAGERSGRKVEGFDLGNSPSEFTPEAVGGREVVMTTTNGTRLLSAAANAEALYVSCFLNLSATAGALAGFAGAAGGGRTGGPPAAGEDGAPEAAGKREALFKEAGGAAGSAADGGAAGGSGGRGEVVLAAAGTEGLFSIEDALCTGLLARRLRERPGVELDDSAAFAALAAERPWEELRELCLGGRGAANVRAAGLEGDLEDCLRPDESGIVARVEREPLRIAAR